MKNRYVIEDDVVRIFLNRRYGKSDLETLIDLEDFDKINAFDGFFCAFLTRENGKYYASINMKNGKKKYILRLHRIILNLGKFFPHVDHINDNSLDNRKSNLRITDNKSNLKNRYDANSNNTSGYRNVSWNKVLNKWVIQLQIEGKNHIFKEKFDDVNEANLFAIEMRKKYYGEFQGR